MTRRTSATRYRRALRIERLESRRLLAVNITDYAIPTSQSGPIGIALGPDGNLWFTESVAGAIGMINPQTKGIQEFGTQTQGSSPEQITAGPGNRLWFTDLGANSLGAIATGGTHAVNEAPIQGLAFPFGVTTGPDGNVWFTETNRNAIDDYNPSSQQFGTEVTAKSTNAEPYGITAGPAGDPNLYFTEQLGNAIGIYDTQTQAKAEVATPTMGSNPSGIAVGPDGNIWFTEGNANQIGVLNRSTRAITEFPIPTANSHPSAIAAGADGNLWFTEAATNKVGRITPSGQITEFDLPSSGSQPAGIAAGPQGTLWVTEPGANKIAEIDLGLIITGTNPANGSVISSLPGGQVVVTFDRPLKGLTDGQSPIQNGNGFNPYDVFLLARGPDGIFSAPSGVDQGDLPLHANVVYHVNADGTSEFVITPTEPLSSDVYAVSVGLSAFTDLAGNPLTDASNGYRTFLLQKPAVNASQPLQVTGVTEYNGLFTIHDGDKVYQPDTIQIHFNKPLYAGAAQGTNVQLVANPGPNFSVVPSVAAYSPTTNSIYLTPTAPLNTLTTYAVRVAGQNTDSSYVSDDQGFGNPGYPLAQTFYDTFTLRNGPIGASSDSFTVATAQGTPQLLPIPSSNSQWTLPVGYASAQFTEPLDPASLGRFSAMLVPRSGGLDTKIFDPGDAPLNATVAVNPNTNQLIIVPSQPVGNDVYLFSLSNMKSATTGDVLKNDIGGVADGTRPYWATFGLASSASPSVVVAGTSAAEHTAAPTTPSPITRAVPLRSRPSQSTPTGPLGRRFLG